MNDAEGLLDWIDITAFAALRRPSLLIDKHVPNGNPSNPAKPTPNKPNGNQEKDKKRKRDVKATPLTETTAQPTTLCNACGYANHSFDTCHKVQDTSIDRSLLNLDRSISFAESARGKYLISQGYRPQFMTTKEVPPRNPKASVQPDSNSAGQKKHYHRGKHPKRKCTLCSLSSQDNSIPLIPVCVSSQASLGKQDITCLLDSGADVD